MTSKTPDADPAGLMREAAEKTVEQARKAFDEALAVTRKVVADAEAGSGQMRDSARDLTRETLDFASESAAATFDLVGKLARARDPQEAMALQKAFLEAQMERVGRQARAFGDGAIRAARDLTKPFDR